MTDDSPPKANPFRAPVMKEVAEHAGVAISSVSRVLNGHQDVSPGMRDRVLKSVRSLGYEPDAGAQSLRTGATLTIGFVAADIGNPLFAEIAQGAETTLRSSGYSMQLANSFNDPALAVQQLRSMQSRRVDGLLLSVSDESNEELREALARAPFPIVLLDRTVPGLSLSSVLSDHRSGITAAVEHLVSIGHRQVALINGSSRVRPSRERAAAAENVVSGLPDARVTVEMGEFSAQHGETTMRRLMALPNRPTAVIAGSNQILVGVLRALRDLKLTVPTDVSLVTCDDVALSEFLAPALSTISRDANQIGSAAAEMLLGRLKGDEPSDLTLPVGFRPTESCGVPAENAPGK